MDISRSLTVRAATAAPMAARSRRWSGLARAAAATLLAASLVACGTTVSGTALPDPGALGSAAVGQIPTELPSDLPTEVPTEIPTEEGGVPAEPDATAAPEDPDVTAAPEEPDVTDIPADPTDFGDIPGFGELPADWPADVVLPEGAVVTFGFSDETGQTALFSVPGITVADLGAYFESSLPAAGYNADQTGEFGGVYSGIFTKDGVSVTVGIIDFSGEITGTITITTT